MSKVKNPLPHKHNVRLESSEFDIVPRLAEFPLQGRTIKVEGHDESQIFSTKRQPRSNSTINAQVDEVNISSKSKISKLVESRRVLNKNRQSIQMIL